MDEAPSENPQTVPPVPMDVMVTSSDAPTMPMREWVEIGARRDATEPGSWYQPRQAWMRRRVALPIWAVLLLIPCLLAALAFGLVLGAHGSGNLFGTLAGRTTTGAGARQTTGGQIPRWTTLQTFTGNGPSNTTPFTIAPGSVWNVTWSCNPQAASDSYHLNAHVARPEGASGSQVVDMECDPNDPSTWRGQTAEYSSGTFYLAIDSDWTWTFTIAVSR